MRKKKLTRNERRVLALLLSPMIETDTRELTRRFYDGNVPKYGQHIVVGILKSLMHKLTVNEASFYIEQTSEARRGPHPMKIKLVTK